MKKNILSVLSVILCVGASVTYAATSRIYCKVSQDWWKADGASVGAHVWGQSGNMTSWPGQRMSAVLGETDMWYIDIDLASYQNIIFTRVSGSGDVADWGAKTEDLTIPTDGKNLFTVTSSAAVWGEPGCTGTWSTYEASGVEPDYYIAGEGFSGVSWDDHVLLTDGEAVYEGLTAGTYKFKITGGNWQGFILGIDAVDAACSTSGAYSGDADGNIVVVLAGEGSISIRVSDGKICLTVVGKTGQPYSGSAVPSRCGDVMLQSFYYDSYKDKGYGRTKWLDWNNGANNTSAAEIGQWFDLIWLPPMAMSEGGTGYHPRNYSNLNSAWGREGSLKTLISTLHQNGARVVADIVINHCANQSSWCDYYTFDFGTYGTFAPDASWICSTDEVNSSSSAGSCRGKATGAADDGYGSEANYGAARDWDHTSTQVQEMCKAYLKWLRNDIKIDGFRYDYCKGFHNSHINDYNTAAQAYFSVMEYWDGNVNTLQAHLTDAGWNTCTFDFATKYTAFNQGIASGNYGKLKGAGLLGAGKARYAVTFLDSHDSFQRDDNEFCGKNNSMKYPGKIQQCYAYLLSMPGIPCVFYPHWVTFKDPIKKMINARYKTGVHSESAVSDEAGNGYYKATITGTNGEIRLLIGPNSGYNTTPSGYTLAVKGENYGVYYKTTSARGDKDKNRTPQDIEEVTHTTSPSRGEKVLRDGQLLIKVGEQMYDIMGNRVQ